jgi:hypothetical protein
MDKATEPLRGQMARAAYYERWEHYRELEYELERVKQPFIKQLAHVAAFLPTPPLLILAGDGGEAVHEGKLRDEPK